MLLRPMMGEGYGAAAPPQPFEFVGRPLCPLPQGARAREASAAHFGQTKPTIISPSVVRAKAGTHDQRRWLWVPALPSLSRGSAGTTIAWPERAPTCGCTKSRLGQFHCFGLILTMEIATSTCRAAEGDVSPHMSPP